jgi:transposase
MNTSAPPYTLEFKEEAIKLVEEQGYTQKEAADCLGIKPKNLSRWINNKRKGTFIKGLNQPSHPADSELVLLRKENKRLKLEREILKKAAAFFVNENR